jgi:hypothetical protein
MEKFKFISTNRSFRQPKLKINLPNSTSKKDV